ncbi:MAG: helix-turn-helix transcriptional regulator [Chloroflexales bacterium]|nr:helix-turn-helix transcriptional regulator [Chloroflexales bacterium]
MLPDERIATALLDAAERIVAEGGLEALSVRHLAGTIGASTRAGYSLFGSKDGLIIALGTRAFTLLRDRLDTRPTMNGQRRAHARLLEPALAALEAGSHSRQEGAPMVTVHAARLSSSRFL